jgi:hypothetical protein
MKFLKFAGALLGIVLVLSLFAAVFEQAGHSPAASAIAGAVTLAIVVGASKLLKTKLPGVVQNGVQVEIWVNYIIERLWKDNKFLKFAFSDDDKVIGGRIVHIPQPGAKPVVRKNRSSYPAVAVRRADTDVTYVLEEYTTDPAHIPYADTVELSYDKIESEYGDHIGQLTETVADDMILKWISGLSGGSRMFTSGDAVAATLSESEFDADGNITATYAATGLRNSFIEADLARAQLMLNNQKVPKTDRYALLTENMEYQLKQSLTATQYRDYSSVYDAENGVVGKLHGFTILTRASVAAATAGGVIKALGAVIDATDSEVSFVWQKNAVARALGEVTFFENLKDALHYGDVFSSLLRAGGRRRRKDNFGVITIVQGTPQP